MAGLMVLLMAGLAGHLLVKQGVRMRVEQVVLGSVVPVGPWWNL